MSGRRIIVRTVLWSALLLAVASVTAGAQLDTLWTRTCGGAGADGARAAFCTGDGGFLLAGYTYSSGAGNVDVYLVKANSAGFPVWTHAYGGPGRDFGLDACATADGGYLVVGHTSSMGAGKLDAYLVKVDAGGEGVWSRTYGGAEDDEAWAVCPANDGGFLVAGRTESFGEGESDVYVLAIDASGDTLWTRTYGGAQGDVATACCRTSDGGYGVGGFTGSVSANRDMWLLKLDAQGDSLWSACEGTSTDADWGWSLCPTTSGGIAVAGSGDTHGTYFQQAYVACFDANGSPEWSEHYGLGTYYDYGWSICPVSEGGFLVAGATKDPLTRENDVTVLRLDAAGQDLWSGSFGGTGSEWGAAVAEISPGSYMVAGQTESRGAGSFDTWLVRLFDPQSGSVPPSGELVPGRLRFEANPFRDRAVMRYVLDEPMDVRLEIVDASGRCLATLINGVCPAGEHRIAWNARVAGAGVYYGLLVAGEERSAAKAIRIR